MVDKFFKELSDQEDSLNKQSAGSLMLMGIIFSSSIFFDDEWYDYLKRKDQTFELIVLSTLHILRKFRETLPKRYDEFEKDFISQVFSFETQVQIIEKLPCDFTDFINSRFILYDDEFSLDEEGQVKFLIHTTYNLFDTPLLKDSGVCEDLFRVIETQVKFISFYERLMINFNFMISKKYA